MRFGTPSLASTPVARLGALMLGLAGAAAATVPPPLLKFQMNEGAANVVSSGTATNATRSSPTPAWSTNTPVGGGSNSLDFGTTAAQNIYVDMPTPASIKGLKSFTITGWLNCKDFATGGGGNRILVNVLPGGTVPGVGKGIDLAFRNDGSLSLGVNQWNDWGGVRSHGGKITTDAAAPYNNWRFFAVTYNSLLVTGQVKFYFGSNITPAELDVSRDYGAGPVGTTSGNILTLGNMNLDNRYSGTNQTFRGLMDQIQVFGNTADGTGALSAADIITVQGATPLTGNGVLYEEFAGITGTTLPDLINHPSYPNNPTSTYVRPSFDGFQYGAVKNDFGVKMSGWIKAPTTGNYTFWISTDDNGELRLSTDANPANKRVIAYAPGWTNYNEWEKIFVPNQPSPQKSALIPLVANQYYYIEALMKEGTVSDHITVQWQIPGASTPESPIPGSRMFLSPPVDGNFPSSYPLYEPFTSAKKATVGWKREAGNGTLYVESDGTKGMTIQNGAATFPDKLFFGGRFPNDPNDNDLGFRWERPTEGSIGKLFLETQGGHWAMKTEAWSEMEPNTEFNELVKISGPDAPEDGSTWNSSVNLHYMSGALFDRQLVGTAPGHYYREYSLLNGHGLTVKREITDNNVTSAESTKVVGGEIIVKGKDLANRNAITWIDGRGWRYNVLDDNGNVLSETFVDGGGITAPVVHATAYVSTLKWKVVPDYVFEEGYKLKSLEETERFVKAKKHLPEIPSAQEMSAKGMDLTDMNLKLLKKMEEMTLHMIAMDKELKAQRQVNGRLERDMRALRAGKGN